MSAHLQECGRRSGEALIQTKVVVARGDWSLVTSAAMQEGKSQTDFEETWA
jgi:hypothetical protein